jgi:hypothetical protein
MQGDEIKTIVAIVGRECFNAEGDKSGGPTLSFPANQPMTAGSNELGGNIYGATTAPDGTAILVPLHKGEWAPRD